MIALVATLSLTPALLVILARIRPRAFDGSGRHVRVSSGTARLRGDGPPAAKLGVHRAGDDAAVDSGPEDPFHPGL